MAEKKTDPNVVELREADDSALRIFTRVDVEDISPTEIYEKAGVSEENRAVFKVRPASPATKDKLKEVRASIDVAWAQIDEESGIDFGELQGILDTAHRVIESDGEVGEGEQAEQYALMQAFGEVQKRKNMVATLAKSDLDTRKILAECTGGVGNYKELIIEDKKPKIIDSEKNTVDTICDMPDVLAVWLFDVIYDRSRLSVNEYLGG